MGERSLFTNKELRTLCALQIGEELDRIPQISFGTQLKAHFKRANRGNKVKPQDGIAEHYYVVRGAEDQFHSHDQCRTHLLRNRFR